MVKAIFFDAAGILYTRDGHTEDFALELVAKSGFNAEISRDQYDTQKSTHSKANEGLITHEAYWDQFLSIRNIQDATQRRSMINRIITYSNDVQPVIGAPETLKKLKESGLVLGIITDTMYPLEWKMRRLEKAGVAEYIDIVSCSTELGAHKPDPAVYAYALQQANMKAEDAAFVGHMGIELVGAHNVGMTTIAIDYDEGAIADFYCNSISDLQNLSIIKHSD